MPPQDEDIKLLFTIASKLGKVEEGLEHANAQRNTIALKFDSLQSEVNEIKEGFSSYTSKNDEILKALKEIQVKQDEEISSLKSFKNRLYVIAASLFGSGSIGGYILSKFGFNVNE